MALTLNAIHLINTTTGGFQRLKISQTEIRGVSFKDDSHITYSIKMAGQWRVYYYQLSTEKVISVDRKWRYIQYKNSAEDTLWFDQQGQLYFGKDKKQVNNELLLKHAVLNTRTFNLQKQGKQWLWYDFSGERSLMRYVTSSKQSERLIQTQVTHFDVVKNKLLYGISSHSNSDIFQTKSFK